MEKAQPGWVILSIPDKCVASTFGVHCTPVGSVGSCFGGGAAATDPKRRPGFQTSRRGAALLKFAADTAASTVLVL